MDNIVNYNRIIIKIIEGKAGTKEMKKDWIKHLAPGRYFMLEILVLFGLSINSRPSIKRRLIKYGAKIKSESLPGTTQFRDVIIWKGFKAEQPKELKNPPVKPKNKQAA